MKCRYRRGEKKSHDDDDVDDNDDEEEESLELKSIKISSSSIVCFGIPI